MILTCPNCKTRYSVDPNSLVPNGKTVRCAQCGHMWVEESPGDTPLTVEKPPAPAIAEESPPSEAETPPVLEEAAPAGPVEEATPSEPEPAGEPPPPGFESWEAWEEQKQAEAEAEAAAMAKAETESAAVAVGTEEAKVEDDDDDDDDFEVPSIEEVTVQANRTPRNASKSRNTAQQGKLGTVIGWSVLVLAILGIGAGGYFMREMIINVWPPATKLYEVLGLAEPKTYTLALGNITPAREREGDTLVLIVTGDVSNITDETQPIPKLRGAILDGQSREIFTWTFDPPSRQLDGGETVTFSTRVPNPPEGARGVAVTFSEVEP